MLQILTTFASRKIHRLLPITGLYILGIAGHTFSTDYRLSMAFAGIIAILLLATRRLTFQALMTLSVLLGAFSLGGFLYTHQHTKFNTFYLITDQKEWDVQGTVIAKEIATGQFGHATTIALKTLKESKSSNPWQPIDATITIYTCQEPFCQVDDQIKASALIFKKPANDNYCTYLLKEGISATLFVPRLSYRLVQRPTYSLFRSLHTTKMALLKSIQNKMSPQTCALFASLFLGNRAISKEELEGNKQNFAIWGLSHYLARSGLHLAIFATLLEMLMRYIPVALTIKHLLAILLSLLYFLLSWSSVSFIRALAMFLLYKACALLVTRIHVVHILTLVTLGTLLYNPTQLFFLDFQLSFGLTGALAWMSCHASKNLF